MLFLVRDRDVDYFCNRKETFISATSPELNGLAGRSRAILPTLVILWFFFIFLEENKAKNFIDVFL